MLEPDLRAILQLARKAGVTEIELARGDLRLRVRRQTDQAAGAPAEAAPGGATPLATADGGEVVVRSPMVGYFYVGAKPGESQAVTPGDRIASGARVGCVETLGVLTDVVVTTGGRVDGYLVADGGAVEYGQPVLRLVATAGEREVGGSAE